MPSEDIPRSLLREVSMGLPLENELQEFPHPPPVGF
jgi:hypothetical protein